MATKQNRQPSKRLNKQPSNELTILSKPEGMYAPDWDKPSVQQARVRPADGTPRRIQVGNDGIVNK
jgi:hypothetical protein